MKVLIKVFCPCTPTTLPPPTASPQNVSFTKAMLYMAAFFASGGFSEKEYAWDVFLDLIGLFLGLVLFATLIGFITDIVERRMEQISEGTLL